MGKGLRITFSIGILSVLCGTLLASDNLTLSPEFSKKIHQLTDRFAVENISVMKLHTLIKDPRFFEDTILLDMRTEEEFAVSHIPGAIHFKGKWPLGKKIIVYCSVGYRSSKKATKAPPSVVVKNLFGGIFEWSNRKLPLESLTNQRTKKIHTYNASWGQWVSYGEKVH